MEIIHYKVSNGAIPLSVFPAARIPAEHDLLYILYLLTNKSYFWSVTFISLQELFPFSI